MASNHILICKCCGKSFEISKRNTLEVCPDCKLHGSVCIICGKPIPFGHKFCSYSCNSKYNISLSNPMDDLANRQKISVSKQPESIRLAKIREEKREEWEKGRLDRQRKAVEKRLQTIKDKGILLGLANPEALAKMKATKASYTPEEQKIRLQNKIEKTRQTCLARYGVTNPAKAPEARLLISEKVTIFRNDPLIKQKAINTLMSRYGVSNAYLVGADFTSIAEREIADFIESLGVTVIRNNHSVLGDRELDIYCPDYNLAIEYNGVYWHSEEKKDIYYHSNKTIRCAAKGIRLIHVYEWEWLDEIKRNILKSLLSVTFGKSQKVFYARRCQIRSVSQPDYRAFCVLNHLQGYRAASVVYGLYNNDELLQLLSFAKPQERGAKKTFQWEIVRSCSSSNAIIVGGINKLWNHFLLNRKPQSVMSYCDLNKFNGHSYTQLGMLLYKSDPVNTWYVNKETLRPTQWLNRGKELREKQLSESFTVHGAGNAVFTWEA